ncbi:MAG: GNAT family N-acetyltransferase [Vicinamibacterales bacterium]
MECHLSRCSIRPFHARDAASLAHHANNRKVWLNLRDRFPHPYLKSHAQEFIRQARHMEPQTFFAIDVGGDAVGSIGFTLHTDVERVSAEIGYWIGEAYWGRGIASEALPVVTRHAIEQHRLTRVFALPFASNAASCRVLEKAGYVLEGRLRRSAIKNGIIQDQCQYAFVVPEPIPVRTDPA